VDNSYLLKWKICIGKKPKINIKYIVSVDEKKNSSIQLKTRNLDYLKAYYKVNLNNSINLNIGSNVHLMKKINTYIELTYQYSKDFKLLFRSNFKYKYRREKRIKNNISFGFNFSGFNFWIPIYLSNFDNKSSLAELMFVNIITHIAGYFTNFLYKRIFCDYEYE